MKRILPLIASLSMSLPLFSAEPSPSPTPAPAVAFDWFEYTGNDAVAAAELPANSYRNPILPGFYPDPSICRVGDDYYLINSTFAYFPGIPIFHSRDLVNWNQIGHVIDRPEQLNYDSLGVSRGIFAPAISHHAGRFYVICTLVDGGGNFVVTATNPAGPWSDPTWLKFEGIDPSFFFDDDGRAWLVNNGNPDGKPLYNGHRAIWIQEFDLKAQKLVGPRSVIVNGGVDLAKKPIWVEGPHLFKRGNWYYLCCAEGGTGNDHSQVIFRSKAVAGPFIPWDKNPILTQRDLPSGRATPVTCTGHAELIQGPDGKGWWSIFLGCRPYQGDYYATGRETFLLPVTWNDEGWPVILPAGQPVPFTAPTPTIPKAKTQAVSTNSSLTGNFTWRDDFTAPALSSFWIMLRQPHETWWSLQRAAGQLSLTPRSERLSGSGNPSFLARRIQHARFETSTALTPPPPTAIGVSAGLAAFQNETHHYYFGVQRTSEGLAVFVERLNGKSPEMLVRHKIPDTLRIELKFTAKDGSCTFAYATQAGEWQTVLPDADATLLTTHAAGGFVGAVIGLHARIESE